jgi:glycosyltransferase involved in cell wall biosynthesis
MKIGIIADPLDNQRAGVHVYTRFMISSLRNSNQKTEISIIREKGGEEIKNIEQIVVPNFRWGIGLSALRLLFVVPFIFWRRKVDIVIEPAHFGPFNLPSRIKRATVIHDLTPLILPKYHRWHSQVLQNFFLKRILGKTDLIIANSTHTSNDICRLFPQYSSKVQMVYPGIDEGFSSTLETGALKRLGIESNYWLFVGTIEPRKNLNTLLEAFEYHKITHQTDDKLVIVGQKGWKSERFFQALANSSFADDIILTGYVSKEELIQLYSHAFVFIYPSIYEGFGFPILEAFSCGCPVICSNVSSLPELGGELAFYIDPANSNQIVEKVEMIASMSETDRNELKQKMAKWANQFTWNRFGQELNQLLLQLMYQNRE